MVGNNPDKILDLTTKITSKYKALSVFFITLSFLSFILHLFARLMEEKKPRIPYLKDKFPWMEIYGGYKSNNPARLNKFKIHENLVFTKVLFLCNKLLTFKYYKLLYTTKAPRNKLGAFIFIKLFFLVS